MRPLPLPKALAPTTASQPGKAPASYKPKGSLQMIGSLVDESITYLAPPPMPPPGAPWKEQLKWAIEIIGAAGGGSVAKNAAKAIRLAKASSKGVVTEQMLQSHGVKYGGLGDEFRLRRAPDNAYMTKDGPLKRIDSPWSVSPKPVTPRTATTPPAVAEAHAKMVVNPKAGGGEASAILGSSSGPGSELVRLPRQPTAKRVDLPWGKSGPKMPVRKETLLDLPTLNKASTSPNLVQPTGHLKPGMDQSGLGGLPLKGDIPITNPYLLASRERMLQRKTNIAYPGQAVQQTGISPASSEMALGGKVSLGPQAALPPSPKRLLNADDVTFVHPPAQKPSVTPGLDEFVQGARTPDELFAESRKLTGENYFIDPIAAARRQAGIPDRSVASMAQQNVSDIAKTHPKNIVQDRFWSSTAPRATKTKHFDLARFYGDKSVRPPYKGVDLYREADLSGAAPKRLHDSILIDRLLRKRQAMEAQAGLPMPKAATTTPAIPPPPTATPTPSTPAAQRLASWFGESPKTTKGLAIGTGAAALYGAGAPTHWQQNVQPTLDDIVYGVKEGVRDYGVPMAQSAAAGLQKTASENPWKTAFSAASTMSPASGIAGAAAPWLLSGLERQGQAQAAKSAMDNVGVKIVGWDDSMKQRFRREVEANPKMTEGEFVSLVEKYEMQRRSKK